jgi:hypothetical protein
MVFFASLVAGFGSFLLGVPWYSSSLFGTAWNKSNGGNPKKGASGHPAVVFITSYLLSVISAYTLGVLLGPNPTLSFALWRSLAIGICVASCFGINYSFANRGVTLFLIDSGYHIV